MKDPTLFNPDRMPPRDDLGYHCHPDLDQFCDGDEGVLEPEDFRVAGFELAFMYLDGDHSEAAGVINDSYSQGNPDVSAWNPEREGWYRAGIWDTEDGPIAVFVQPVVQL